MLAAGIVFMVVGAIVGLLSFGGGLLGISLGLPIGGWLFSLGFLLAIAGAIVNAIHEHKNAVLAEMRGEREDLRIGFKSLWDELDRVRANTEPSAPVPVYGTKPISPDDGQLQETTARSPSSRSRWEKIDEIERGLDQHRQ